MFFLLPWLFVFMSLHSSSALCSRGKENSIMGDSGGDGHLKKLTGDKPSGGGCACVKGLK